MSAIDRDRQFRAQVETALEAHVKNQRHELTDIGSELDAFFDGALAAVTGGKFLRASFCRAGWQAMGRDDLDPRIISAASAFEWLQSSALIHDDLMDGSDTRRGHPSAHRAFELRHQQLGLAGDAAAYGMQVAILLGDLLLSWADQTLRTAGIQSSDWQLDEALVWWDLAKTEVIAGQFLDVSAQTHSTFNFDHAMHVVRFKAAKYTVERPVHVGAALAGADATELEKLSAVSLPLGEAFQLRDDILGVFGDPQVTGKPAGDDLREGKRTALIARTAELADADTVRRLLGSGTGAPELAKLIKSSGALASIESEISRLEAQIELAMSSLSAVAQAALRPLISATIRRER